MSEAWRCPYCWEPVADMQSSCCGERGHAEPDPQAEAEQTLQQQQMAADCEGQ